MSNPQLLNLPDLKAPQPKGTPPVVSFALAEQDGDIIEFTVRVTQGTRYRETIWNEVETPEIRRLFDEFTKAAAALG